MVEWIPRIHYELITQAVNNRSQNYRYISSDILWIIRVCIDTTCRKMSGNAWGFGTIALTMIVGCNKYMWRARYPRLQKYYVSVVGYIFVNILRHWTDSASDNNNGGFLKWNSTCFAFIYTLIIFRCQETFRANFYSKHQWIIRLLDAKMNTQNTDTPWCDIQMIAYVTSHEDILHIALNG